MSQFYTLFFFLTGSLASGWAADYSTRSRCGFRARVFCYLELYVPTISWFLATYTFTDTVLIFQNTKDDDLKWLTVSPYALFLALASAMIVIAYRGVLRRWHPAGRIGAFVLCVGLLVMLVRRTPWAFLVWRALG